MRTTTGDIFGWLGKADAICITTNGMIRGDGRAVMGAGNARTARDRFPSIDRKLAASLRIHGNAVVLLHTTADGTHIVAFPTKWDWKDLSDGALIRTSALGLKLLTDRMGWENVILPPAGCGLGGLKWSEVKEILSPYLDDRFLVVASDAGVFRR